MDGQMGSVDETCKTCGKAKTNHWKVYREMCKCDWKPLRGVGYTGWICPVCGRGNAPTTSTCSCKGFDYTVTCGVEK
jgi:hypothetical protein